jgi:hypothetical protein
MPVKILYPDGRVEIIEGKPRKARPTFVGPRKPYPWPPKPPEPEWPMYSPSRKFRIRKQDGKYHLEKKGWFLWSYVQVATSYCWFFELYGDAIYSDWEKAVDRMKWEEL